MRVKEIMTSPVVTVRPETTVKEAATLLVQRGIDAVPVVGEDGTLAGIVSESDLLPLELRGDPRSEILAAPPYARDHSPETVAEVMTARVISLPEDADVAEAARRMLENRVNQIPITRDDQVVGIVARRDLLKVVAREDEAIRGELLDLLREGDGLLGPYDVDVVEGVALLRGGRDRSSRRLADILARSVPGVIEVRFEDAGTGSE
ncbi:MAG TPA: CBS domain-containing protein [Actinomycetota bacterium]|nr:CBS domain-containing protein [Actinomycetota bacterium]